MDLRLVALPVLVIAILSQQSCFAQARKIFVNDKMDVPIDIGNIEAEETTVGQLKKIISSHSSIELNSLILSRNCDTIFLEDDKLISEYYDNIRQVEVRIRDDLEEPNFIHVFIKKQKYEIIVTKNRTLQWLKKEVLGQEEIHLYRVFFEGQELQNDTKTLGEYKIFKGASLGILKTDEQYSVFVMVSGSWLELAVNLETTIRDLKGILEKENPDTKNGLLVYSNFLTDDNRPVRSYSRVFFLSVGFKLVKRLAETGGNLEMFYRRVGFIQHFPVYVIANNTVADLKRYTFSVESSIPLNRMVLKFGDQILDDNTRKLGDFDFFSGARVSVERNTTEPSDSEDEPTLVDPSTNNEKMPIDWDTNSQEPRNECWICYEDMTENEATVITECGHEFHQRCLNDWRNNGKYEDYRCPNCRCRLSCPDSPKEIACKSCHTKN